MALSKVNFNSMNVTPAASKAIKFNSNNNGLETGDLGGALVLISEQTASDSASIQFTSGIDSTYKEYIFKYINLHPASDSKTLEFNLSADGGSNYSTATLVAMPDFSSGIKMAKVNDLSVTAGTSLKYKIEFANQASGSKEARIRGVSLQY